MSNIITDLEKSLPPIQGQFQDINITSRVQEEIDFWNGKREENPLVFDRLKQYWDYVNVNDWSPSGTPWSSAFISYQLRGKDFPRTSAHRIYVQDIIDNKHPSWIAFSLPKTKLSLHNHLIQIVHLGSFKFWRNILWMDMSISLITSVDSYLVKATVVYLKNTI